jgi:hypothetical protein
MTIRLSLRSFIKSAAAPYRDRGDRARDLQSGPVTCRAGRGRPHNRPLEMRVPALAGTKGTRDVTDGSG